MRTTKFTLYKVSVELADKLSLFREEKPKHEVVKDAFDTDQPIIFEHQGSTLAYVKHKIVGDYIIASLGKQSEAELSGPPSTGFKAVSQEEWPHILVIVCVSPTQPLGQTIAVMKDSEIFSAPIHALRSLVSYMTPHNELLHGYELILSSLSRTESFWEIIKTRDGRIQRLSFDLAVPNFLGLNDEISKSMKTINRKYNATKATIAIENPEGSLHVPLQDEFVQEAVNYASEGAGDIKIKVQEEGVIDAKKNIITASISSLDAKMVIESEDPKIIKAVCDKLFSCLKHSD